MAPMGGCVGSILAVRLLGCTRTDQIIRDSKTIGLNLAYRTAGSNGGHMWTYRAP